ncbi:hypothetical protein F5Y10DRAFT_266980 [Nemania abortiva]|nr:hypothetical protein F5Y10DRAFT_266980 [Nemania abortiva]
MSIDQVLMEHQTYAPENLEIAGDILDISKALGIQPGANGSIESLVDLVRRLETVGYFPLFFKPYIAKYDWGSHDPVKALSSRARYVSQWAPSSMWSGDIESFSHCLAQWGYCIFTEVEGLLSQHGDGFMWFPESRPHREAFAYALFLLMCQRDGQAPEIIPMLYKDVLRYLSDQLSLLPPGFA